MKKLITVAVAAIALAAAGCGGGSADDDDGQVQGELELPEPTIYDYGWFCMTKQVTAVSQLTPALGACLRNADGKPESEANPYRRGVQDAFTCFTTPKGEGPHMDWLAGTGGYPVGCGGSPEYLRRVSEADE